MNSIYSKYCFLRVTPDNMNSETPLKVKWIKREKQTKNNRIQNISYIEKAKIAIEVFEKLTYFLCGTHKEALNVFK